MKNIKLEKLNDIIFIDETNDDVFMGYNTTKHIDINGIEYELRDYEAKYYFLSRFASNSAYVSEERLLDMILCNYIDSIESNSIYGHGYTEGRLIPSNHEEVCQEEFLGHVIEEMSSKIEDMVRSLF